MVGGLRDWKRLWCVMRQQHLRCWNFPEDVGRKMPHYCADLTDVSTVHTDTITTTPPPPSLLFQDMVVDCAPRLAMRRPNSLLITDSQAREMFLAFESLEEQLQWMDSINQVCVYMYYYTSWLYKS